MWKFFGAVTTRVPNASCNSILGELDHHICPTISSGELLDTLPSTFYDEIGVGVSPNLTWISYSVLSKPTNLAVTRGISPNVKKQSFP